MTAEHESDIEVTAEFERIINEFFRAVSFEHGQQPAYRRLHDLFIADGKIIKNSGDSPEISTVAQFINPRQAMVDAGELTSFYEGELAGLTEVFGNVAHRLSAYEKHGTMSGAPVAGKGIIFTQFIHTPDGWKISSMAWDDERPGLTIPDRYV